MTNPDVSIRGAGAVGLALALSLARQGLAVQLVDGPAPGTTGPTGIRGPDVRTYALNAASRALLTQLKVRDALPPDAVTAVDDMAVAGDAAGAQIDFSAWQQGAEALAWIVDAAALEDALATAARYAPHLSRSAVESPAALRVLAEGKASASRDALGVHWQRQAYGQTALAARLVSDQPHAHLARQWFRCPDVLALLPFDRPQPAHSYGLVWSLPAERCQALLDAPVAEFEAALAEATAGAAGGLRLASARAAWPLAVAQAQPLSGPGWVLVGDAAHVVHPLAGQGLNLGLADVVALSAVIAQREPWRALGDERLLRRYGRQRAAPTRVMALVTDGLLHLFAQPQPAVKELRNRGMGLLNHLAPLKRARTQRALDA
ncbi:MAG: 2-octaprenyl-3-methyl-6-methoxy-1,4-benzoquinol hydroxylase [Burkholderiales bacterium PBB5]|nr:MAG: 2-octaprenyl-3-methyl-6-methoxy-1,4-benzoquinol hydroxylase [Burkholderiales bacterium PBB5]